MTEEARVRPESARLFPKLDPARWYEVRRRQPLGLYIWDGSQELFVVDLHFDIRERPVEPTAFDD